MYTVTLIPGDWIGPECCAIMQQVVAKTGVDISWDVHAIENGVLSQSLLDSCTKNKVIFKAKVDAPRKLGVLPPTLQLRKALGMWASVRPVRALPSINAKFTNIDVVLVREISEDIFSGFEHEVTENVYEAVKITTPEGCERIARYAFEYARANGRKKVTIAHKSNIMKQSDGLFLRVAKKVAEEYPEIQTKDAIVDALCMQLVRWADDFDVLLSPNLFGDILSDLCSGLGGGITASPSACYGNGMALFETLHGNAPDLVQQNKANPIPVLNTAIMMLEHLGEKDAANKIQSAIDLTVQKGIKTFDLGGTATTTEVGQAIIDHL